MRLIQRKKSGNIQQKYRICKRESERLDLQKKNKTDEVVKHTSNAAKRKKNKANEKDKKEQRANKETEIKIT